MLQKNILLTSHDFEVDLSPILGTAYKLVGALSKLINSVLPLVYGAASSSVGRENPELTEQLLSDAGNLFPSLSGIVKALNH